MRSFFFTLYFFTANLLLFIFCLIFLLAGGAGARFSSRIWARAMVFGAKYIAGINFEIRGEIPQTPVIYASRHQSAWDTMFFLMLPHSPVYVFKKELIFIPIFGLFLWLDGHVLVNRGAGARALKKMLRDVQSRISAGRSIVIFPEGTRTKPTQLGEIKPGIAAIYNNVDAPVIPVSLNSGEFWPKGGFHKFPGKIILEFHKPLAKNLSRAEVLEQLSKKLA